jgi:hypothetical protein
MKKFSDLNLPKYIGKDSAGRRVLDGEKVRIIEILNTPLIFLDAEANLVTKYGNKKNEMVVVQVQLENSEIKKFLTASQRLVFTIKSCIDRGSFPFTGTIKQVLGKPYIDYYIE